MNIQKTLLTLAACLLFGFAHAQLKHLKSADDTKALTLKAVVYFKDAKIPELINILKPYWPLPQEEMDGMEEKTIDLLNLIEERYGKYQSYVKVKEETIIETGIRETYLVKYEFHALRLEFTYYKNNSGWILNGFSWDDKYAEEFK